MKKLLTRTSIYISLKAFNIKPPLSYYHAKMNTRYLGVSHLGYLCTFWIRMSPFRCIFYGVAYPCRMEYQGKLYLAAQSGDTMTNPKYAGKGLFTTLAKMTYDLARTEGIQFIFGFPNSNSYPGFVKKLSWTHLENMSDYKIKVFALPLAAVAKKFPLFEKLYSYYSSPLYF